MTSRRLVVACTGVRHAACVSMRRLSTKEYSTDARERLALAHTRAREAAGYPSRPKYAAAVPDVGLRSIVKIEQADPVGQLVLEATARFLPGWTEETPRIILEGGPIPPVKVGAGPAESADDEEERLILALTKLDVSPETIAKAVREHRARSDQKQGGAAIRQVSDLDTR
jgi:hypothetical protein